MMARVGVALLMSLLLAGCWSDDHVGERPIATPKKYQGREMKVVHQGMRISGGEFDAMKKDLKDTLMGMRVGEKEQDELFKMIESARREIVEVP